MQPTKFHSICIAAFINVCQNGSRFFSSADLLAQRACWVDFVDVCVRDRSSVLVAGGVRSLYLMSLIFASALAWWALVIGCFSSIAFSEHAEASALSPRSRALGLHIIYCCQESGRDKRWGDEQCEREAKKSARRGGESRGTRRSETDDLVKSQLLNI